MSDLLIFIIGLFIIAAFLRVNFFFYILYILFGAYLFAKIWTQRASRNLTYRRSFEKRIFLGERVTVNLDVINRGLLPIPWAQINESLPIRLVSPNFFRQVLSLPPKGHAFLSYDLSGRHRGYYPIGPLSLDTGDVWGIETREKRAPEVEHLTVYPKIVPLEKLTLPSKSPMGTLRSKVPIFQDPSRVIGVRDYVPGDSLRLINWKTTANVGRLQVKRLEPAISVETAIFLNLNTQEYDAKRALEATELGIVAAASLANHVIALRQAVGLSTNGVDPLATNGQPITLPLRKERAHLMRILDVLARIQAGEAFPFTELLRQESLNLSWGVTLLVITSGESEELFDTLFPLRRAGFHVVLLFTDSGGAFAPTKGRAESLGFRAWRIRTERDLESLE